jgi:hypothetical protein
MGEHDEAVAKADRGEDASGGGSTHGEAEGHA